MHIQREWKIELNEQDFAAVVGGSMEKLLARPSVREDWEAALAETQSLVHPAAIWETFPIRAFKHERVILEGGNRLTGGPVAEVMAGASQLLVGMCTVGGEINRRISELHTDGERVRAMFLDALGTAALGQVRQQMFEQLEREILDEGLHASTPLAPGESTWPIGDQAVLFALVDAGQIGIHLTESMMMNPLKSTSMVMGIGAGPLGSEGGVSCDFCTIKDTCQYRKRSQPQGAPA